MKQAKVSSSSSPPQVCDCIAHRGVPSVNFLDRAEFARASYFYETHDPREDEIADQNVWFHLQPGNLFAYKEDPGGGYR